MTLTEALIFNTEQNRFLGKWRRNHPPPPRLASPPASNFVLLTVRPTAFPLAWDHSLSLLSLYIFSRKKNTPDRRLPSPEKEDWRWMVTYYSRLHDKFTDLLTWSPIWRSASFSSLLWFFYSFQNTATMSSLSSSTSSTVCKIAY